MCASSYEQGLSYGIDNMDTIAKLYRYLAIHEAYKAVLNDAGKYAKSLSHTAIYEEVQKYLLDRYMQVADVRTIQRALSSPVLTAEQIERRR